MQQDQSNQEKDENDDEDNEKNSFYLKIENIRIIRKNIRNLNICNFIFE